MIGDFIGKICFAAGTFITAAGIVLCDTAYGAEKYSEWSYVCKDLKGNKRWEARSNIKPLGDKVFLLTEEGSGVYSGFEGPVRWKAETKFLDDGQKIEPLEMKKTVFGEDGKALFEGTQEFGKGTVTSLKKWLDSAREVKKTFNYDLDIVNEFTLALYTKRFLKNGDREKTFYLVTNDPDLYKVTAKVEGEEEITIGGTKKTAFKMHLKAEAGLLSVFAAMLPQTYVWHLARPEFDWLKYHGAEDTLDSILVEIERLG